MGGAESGGPVRRLVGPGGIQDRAAQGTMHVTAWRVEHPEAKGKVLSYANDK